MTLSDEGARFLTKAAIVVFALLVTAFFRTLIGRNPKRNVGMLLGTIGGMAAGIAASSPLSEWIGEDVSSLSAMAGVILGWCVAYQFVKHLPRDLAQPGSH